MWALQAVRNLFHTAVDPSKIPIVTPFAPGEISGPIFRARPTRPRIPIRCSRAVAVQWLQRTPSSRRRCQSCLNAGLGGDLGSCCWGAARAGRARAASGGRPTGAAGNKAAAAYVQAPRSAAPARRPGPLGGLQGRAAGGLGPRLSLQPLGVGSTSTRGRRPQGCRWAPARLATVVGSRGPLPGRVRHPMHLHHSMAHRPQACMGRPNSPSAWPWAPALPTTAPPHHRHNAPAPGLPALQHGLYGSPPGRARSPAHPHAHPPTRPPTHTPTHPHAPSHPPCTSHAPVPHAPMPCPSPATHHAMQLWRGST
jgi:hypothetical protein